MKEKELDDLAVIAEVASMYYEFDIPQNLIAERMFYSKAKVSRLLKKAREYGIVEININYPIQRVSILETMLTETFGLKDSIVIRNYPEHNNPEIRLKRLGKIAAGYLDNLLEDGDTIGIAWGRTLYQMVSSMKPDHPKKICIIQLMGAATEGYNMDLDAPSLIRIMAEKYKGVYMPLYAPLYVGNSLIKQALEKEPLIYKTLQAGKKANYIVTGIADFTADKTISWAGYLTPPKMEEYIKRGAVGFICGHFIDRNGRNVLPDIESNMVGISLEDLKRNQHVIAVAGGVDKALATYAALKGGYINCLITDVYIAEKIIAIHQGASVHS